MENKGDAFDLVVIGGGPAGYVGAIRAAQLGMKTALVEKDRLGGVCLNMGCIPSKSLIHQAEVFRSISELEKMGIQIDRSEFRYEKVFRQSRIVAEKLSKGVQFLMKKNGIQVFSASARFASSKDLEIDGIGLIHANRFLIATGTSPRTLEGFEADEKTILSSTGALMLQEVPVRLLVIGSGAIGMELGDVFRAFGAEVTIAEILPSILPTEDYEISRFVHQAFQKKGIRILTQTKVMNNGLSNSGLLVTFENSEQGIWRETFTNVLVAVGRKPNTEGLGLDRLGFQLNQGYIPVGDSYQTTVPHIFAAGDVIGPPLLAHLASKESEIAVESMAGFPTISKVPPENVPGATYCTPQVGSFGKRETDLERVGTPYKKYVFPYRGIGKAVAMGKSEGMIKLLSDPSTHQLLGAHIVGEQATELIHELLLSKTEGIPIDAAARMIHSHPTISEGIMEACRGLDGWAIHV